MRDMPLLVPKRVLFLLPLLDRTFHVFVEPRSTLCSSKPRIVQLIESLPAPTPHPTQHAPPQLRSAPPQQAEVPQLRSAPPQQAEVPQLRRAPR